jgi:hypothetical protein
MLEGYIGPHDLGVTVKPGTQLVAEYFREGSRFGLGLVLEALPERKGSKKVEASAAQLKLRVICGGEDRTILVQDSLHQWVHQKEDFKLRWPKNDSEAVSLQRLLSKASTTVVQKATRRTRTKKQYTAGSLTGCEVFKPGSVKSHLAKELADGKLHSLKSLVSLCKQYEVKMNMIDKVVRGINKRSATHQATKTDAGVQVATRTV